MAKTPKGKDKSKKSKTKTSIGSVLGTNEMLGKLAVAEEEERKGYARLVESNDSTLANTSGYSSALSSLTMRLFGVPYQFPDQVDPRIKQISPYIGKKFLENIMTEGPVCTIIPGKPKFLPSDSNKVTKENTATSLLQAAGGSFSGLQQLIDDNTLDDMRLYDFEIDYNNYMKYVNILCRAGASFLGLQDTVSVGTTEYSFQNYDWRNYRWDTVANMSLAQKGESASTLINSLRMKNTGTLTDKIFKLIKGDTTTDENISINDLLTNYNYVQFYIDPDLSPTDNISNNTTQSTFKSLLDQGSNTMKEISFMANSGGIDSEVFQKFADDSASSLAAFISKSLGDNGVLGQAGSAISRFLNLSGDVVKGNNLIIPDIYESSSYTKSYSLTCHLKAPYGDKLSYYLDVFVPMMHLIALGLPRQDTSNSYSSPFLVKFYVEGVCTCNLGLVTNISINKIGDSVSADGLYNEVDVSLEITDLYSDLTMNNSDAPMAFINNSSLIEYLATNCGMSLTKPNYEKKYSAMFNNFKSKFTDIPTSVKTAVDQSVFDLISSFTSLY